MNMVDGLVNQARKAQRELEQLSENEVRKIVLACAWAVLNPETNQKLSEEAVLTTGIGKVGDKVIKNERKTLGLLQDIDNQTTFGVVSESEELGIIEIVRPVGVVGALTPSTNPIATPLNNIINSIICRNAIIISPSPKGSKVLDSVLNLIDKELHATKAPKNIIQRLPVLESKEESKQLSEDLMKKVDLVVCTGSRNNVRKSYTCGTPALGVGVGNVPVIVDETANLKAAAQKVKLSKTFDHATSCSSENSLVIVDSVYSSMVGFLKEEGGRLLTSDEKKRLQKSLWINGNLNPKLIAHSAEEILTQIGMDGKDGKDVRGVSFLMVEETGIGADSPFSGEKLSPVLTIYRADDFEASKTIVSKILNYDGKGHSVGIHTQDKNRGRELGLELEVARIIVNQPHCVATGGSFENNLPVSLSMGCGTWGGNSFSDNLNFRHFSNRVRVASPIKSKAVTLDEVFGSYLKERKT